MNKHNAFLEKMWKKNYSSSAKFFVMLFNFLFGILPGISYILRNVFVDDEKVMIQASFGSPGYWVYFFVFLMGFIQNLIELIYFKRFMTVQLVKTYFVAQILTLIMLILATNNTFIVFLRKLIKQNKNDKSHINLLKKITLLLILLIICLSFFFIYKNSYFSELRY
jgi:hypothetical protein